MLGKRPLPRVLLAVGGNLEDRLRTDHGRRLRRSRCSCCCDRSARCSSLSKQVRCSLLEDGSHAEVCKGARLARDE